MNTPEQLHQMPRTEADAAAEAATEAFSDAQLATFTDKAESAQHLDNQILNRVDTRRQAAGMIVGSALAPVGDFIEKADPFGTYKGVQAEKVRLQTK